MVRPRADARAGAPCWLRNAHAARYTRVTPGLKVHTRSNARIARRGQHAGFEMRNAAHLVFQATPSLLYLTVRTAEQEVALRRVARLADVEADKGMAEEISLEDADMWYASDLMGLRERARIPLSRAEIVEFLSRGYENCARNFEACRCVPIHEGNQHGWPSGHAVVFTWTGDDGPHPAIEDMLDVIGIDAVRTSFEGRDAIVGLLDDRRARHV